jgi:error-prone DNA polymerase
MAPGAKAHLSAHPPTPAYAELHAHSDHSLLDGVPSPEALVARAAELDLPAIALTDHDALYGAVRFVLAARQAGVKPLLGAEMTLEDGSHLTLLVETAEGYANLCRLITLARRGQEKGTARLAQSDLAHHTGGLIALSGCPRGEIPRLATAGSYQKAQQGAQRYARLFGPRRFFIELQRHHRRGDKRLSSRLVELAEHTGLDVVATGNTHYLHPPQREVHDVLTCIRHHTTLEDAGALLRPNSEYHLRSPQEMSDLFTTIPTALENSLRIAERCAPATDYLPSGPQTLPLFPVPGGRPASFYLRELCLQELQRIYSEDPPRDLLERELAVIEQAGLADYFLIVWDIVRFARRASVRCQGRGSAANSLVAYLLGISPIDPVTCDLVFERFLSPERCGPPDIDIDFAADRREEIIQYVYRRYGEEHAAMACTLITYRARSAVRDTARAIGFPPALVERLADTLDVGNARSIEESKSLAETFGTDLAGQPFQNLLRIVPQLDSIPRHLGIHNGGMVLAGPPLCELVPLEPATMPDRVVTQWDKDSLEGAGMVKIDLLGLRMLSAIEDAAAFAAAQTGKRPALEQLTPDDPRVYDLICRGDTIGIFQVESRAQSTLIPRFQPRSFADLVIEISLIRPGPIQGNMVHPFLRRRQGLDPVTYTHPLLEQALAETLGVIVYQEQVLKVARDLAGFTPGKAELLRRALSNKRAEQQLARFRDDFLAGALERGVPLEAAEKTFTQLLAFGSYSFPKSHAAAFAVLTYQSAWLRCYHPAAFLAAILRHQPMGFYPPHVVVSDARRIGLEVRPVDVEASDLQTTVEDSAIRLGLALVTGLGETGRQSVVEARSSGPFHSLADFCRRTKLDRRAVESLIWAGAFDRWGLPRRQLAWDLQAASEVVARPPGLSLALSPGERPRFDFLSAKDQLLAEVAHTGVTASHHPTSLVRDRLDSLGATPSTALPELRDGGPLRVGGIIVSAQRPPTAKGTAFLALEDEGGLMNIILRPEVYEANRKALKSPFVAVDGRLQRRGKAITVIATKVIPLNVEAPSGRSGAAHRIPGQ